MISFESQILEACEAKSIDKIVPVQELWSGYGKILRIHLIGGLYKSVIAKIIEIPSSVDHPRGWNTSFSNERKLISYRVESRWYENYASSQSDGPRLPHLIAVSQGEVSKLILLEDLKEAGFNDIREQLSYGQIKSVLNWLADFHGRYLGVEPKEIWPIGTYWHLATRPDEFKKMQTSPLKSMASEIDKKLSDCKYQTFVHGDAKQANFMFDKEGRAVAVDFQYVGGGCGIKDVIYFFSSCLNDQELKIKSRGFLGYYFSALEKVIACHHPKVNFKELKLEWSNLYAYAWADFARFLLGWSPNHYKLNDYVISVVKQIGT